MYLYDTTLSYTTYYIDTVIQIPSFCFENETYSNRNSILKESVGAARDIAGFEIREKIFKRLDY